MKLRFVAETLQDKIKGLQGSQPLAEDEGALFTYDKETPLQYWNSGVDYPIDIAFFDKDKNLINFASMEAQQTENVKSQKPAKYVLETKAGFFKNKKVENLNEIITLNEKS